MTLPPTPHDDTRPVVLEEPERQLAPQWDKDFALRPEENGTVHLNPGWAAILAPGETPLWQGQPSPDPRMGPLGRMAAKPMQTIIIAAVMIMVLLNLGINPAIVPLILVFLFLALRKSIGTGKANASLDRRYLLTNRAAYLARTSGATLLDIQAFPITPNMRLAFGPRAVAFTTRRNAKGQEEAEGFLDISDASAVHTMIRDLQKGQA